MFFYCSTTGRVICDFTPGSKWTQSPVFPFQTHQNTHSLGYLLYITLNLWAVFPCSPQYTEPVAVLCTQISPISSVLLRMGTPLILTTTIRAGGREREREVEGGKVESVGLISELNMSHLREILQDSQSVLKSCTRRSN